MGRTGERSHEELVALAVKADGALTIEGLHCVEELPPSEFRQTGRQFRNRHRFACLENLEQPRFRKGRVRHGGPPVHGHQAHPIARAASR